MLGCNNWRSLQAEREESRNGYIMILIKEAIRTVGHVPKITFLACLLASFVPAALQQGWERVLVQA